MRRVLLWLGVLLGAALMAAQATLDAPTVALPLGLAVAVGCALVLQDTA